MQLDPNFSYAYTLLGLELSSLEKYEEAIEEYNHAIFID